MPLQMAFRMIFPFQIYIQRMQTQSLPLRIQSQTSVRWKLRHLLQHYFDRFLFPHQSLYVAAALFLQKPSQKSIAEANPASVTAIFIYVSKHFVTQLLVRKMFAESPCNPCGWNKRAILHRMDQNFTLFLFLRNLCGEVPCTPPLPDTLLLCHICCHSSFGIPGYSAWSFSFLLTYRI